MRTSTIPLDTCYLLLELSFTLDSKGKRLGGCIKRFKCQLVTCIYIYIYVKGFPNFMSNSKMLGQLLKLENFGGSLASIQCILSFQKLKASPKLIVKRQFTQSYFILHIFIILKFEHDYMN